MAEISREDAICSINTRYSIMDYVEDGKLEEALDKAISDMEKLDKIEKSLGYIDEAIRCAMCTNTMANYQGCDGGCRVNEGMYKSVMNVIDKEINQILRG